MTQRGGRDSGNYNLPPLYEAPRDKGPVFPGKPHKANNLAVQRSLMEIFDEFTTVISGELKSLNLEAFEQERDAQKKPGS